MEYLEAGADVVVTSSYQVKKKNLSCVPIYLISFFSFLFKDLIFLKPTYCNL